ncbi:DUF6980 family protein [Qipengyuania aestuarii]|uniref:DUF6980 family protein n=1 Tax=Qipengyuania aestuarii TaxID=2867241 RepID=UPI003CD0D190
MSIEIFELLNHRPLTQAKCRQSQSHLSQDATAGPAKSQERSRTRLRMQLDREGKGMSSHCCEMMRENVENVCDRHEDRFECPDALIHCSEAQDRYGLIIHDGGTSIIRISYCPWCATKLQNGLG